MDSKIRNYTICILTQVKWLRNILRSHCFLIKKQVSVKSGPLRFKRCQIIGCSKKSTALARDSF